MCVWHLGDKYKCVVVRLGRYGEDRCCLLGFISRGGGRCGDLDVECVGVHDKDIVEKQECEE